MSLSSNIASLPSNVRSFFVSQSLSSDGSARRGCGVFRVERSLASHNLVPSWTTMLWRMNTIKRRASSSIGDLPTEFSWFQDCLRSPQRVAWFFVIFLIACDLIRNWWIDLVLKLETLKLFCYWERVCSLVNVQGSGDCWRVWLRLDGLRWVHFYSYSKVN